VRIWRSLDDVPRDLGRSVVVIGNFDGVHLGHRHVVQRARELADADGLQVVAVTFDPHPIAVLRPEHAPLALTGIDRRCYLLSEAGVDDVLVIPFSREIAAWSPQEFVDRVVVGGLHAAAVVVGGLIVLVLLATSFGRRRRAGSACADLWSGPGEATGNPVATPEFSENPRQQVFKRSPGNRARMATVLGARHVAVLRRGAAAAGLN